MAATADVGDDPRPTRRPSALLPGLLLGIGLGGFVDGILLHQVLQWHHMLTNTGSDRLGLTPHPATTVAGLEVNTLWDGLFHVVAYVFVLVGLAILWRRFAPTHAGVPRRSLAGLLLAGWGTFNLVEGVIDHHVLAIHHVRPGPDQLAYDLGFLAFGAVLLIAGFAIHRAADRE